MTKMHANKPLYHVLFWAGIYCLWLLIFRSYSFPLTKAVTVEFCYLVFIAADFYAISSFVVPQYLFKKRYALFIVATIIVIAASAWLRALVALQMNRHFFHAAPPDFPTLYLRSLLNIALWVLLVTTGKMLIDRKQTQQQLEYLEQERLKNELDYLKAQINPHALLNSLNTIYGHIDKHNQVARNILLQFADLLKYQLYECGSEKVGLEKELDYLANYVSFQRLRKDEALKVELHIAAIAPGLRIAPLLLIVLIENAFKFVSNYPDKENSISITITTNQDKLHCQVVNTRESQQLAAATGSGGIGLANLERRLALLYNNKHELAVKDEAHSYETTLTIDLA